MKILFQILDKKMKRTRIFSDTYHVNYRFEEHFEIVKYQDSEIPFLFLKNSFENNFYYFHRFKISITELEFFPLTNSSNKLKVGLIANSFEDMKLSPRLIRDYELLKTANTEVTIIPVGCDWNLSEDEASFYRQFVADYFDLLISLGGDDLHPTLYNQPNSLAKNVNLDRDMSEFKLVKHYKEKSQGIFLGICRGHQLSAVVDGYELIQDLSEVHNDCLDRHQKIDDNKPEYLYHEITMIPSLLSRLFGFKDTLTRKIVVNSFHHQAVKKCTHVKNYCVAYDTEHEIIEALITRDSKSISVQFHPELPNEINKNEAFTELGNKFIYRVIGFARLNRIRNKKANLTPHESEEIKTLKKAENV